MATDLNPAHDARCNALVTQIGLALASGELTREAAEGLLGVLHGDGDGIAWQQARALDKLFQDALAASQPPPPRGKLVREISFARGGDRSGLSVYGPGNNERWGQNVKDVKDSSGKVIGQTCDRTGWYHPDHGRQEDDSLHLDLLPDSRTVAGKPGWKTWFGATTAPREFRFEVIASMVLGDGVWSDFVWATSRPFGWAGIEIDHMETFGAPKGQQGHNQFATPTHIGFDKLSSKPMTNVEPRLLGRNHWHDPVPGIHNCWIEVVENPTKDGFVILRGIDETTISMIDTAEFHAKGYRIDEIFPAITGWNLYSCTQASAVHVVKPLIDAVVLYSMRVYDMAQVGS